MMLKECFGKKRIIALAGDKSSGKTNNLMALIQDFRQQNKQTKIYVYGLNQTALDWIHQKFKETYEVSSLTQLTNKENALIIIEEFQLLNLNNRRYTDQLNKFIDFIYHNNNWVIFSSANLREYNSVIGSKIEGWLLKTLSQENLVNGSQLKTTIQNYNGRYKRINDIVTPQNTILIINEEHEKTVTLPYIKEVDTKQKLTNIFEPQKTKK